MAAAAYELTLHHGRRTTVLTSWPPSASCLRRQVVGVTTAALDITEQRQAQRTLVRAEKLSLAAKMATPVPTRSRTRCSR